jgi:TatD DNase family protein
MALVDTHCHLDFNNFDSDRLDVLSRAQQAGLTRIINPGVDLENSKALIQLCETYPEIYAAVGVHPNSALTWGERTIQELRQLAQHPKVVAIGEIGLDFYHDRAPKDLQIRILNAQLELADELELPVILHSRQAESDTLDVLADWVIKRKLASSAPGVLHSYGGDEPTAQQAIAMGFYIGITGPVTFRNAVQLQQMVTRLPLTRLLVETDAPFLAPHPYRGKRNEPAYVRLVAEKIAYLKDQSLENIMEQTTANAEQLFQWS